MAEKSVRVPGGLHRQARFFAATRAFWQWLGQVESAAVREELDEQAIDRPLYVAALARSGTTILTEMLERHPEVTAHHYSDFPNVWTPYWRNYLLQITRRQAPAPEERAHKDRIMVSQDSPEAVEEVLWMHFFPACHESGHDNTLDATVENRIFESFYRNHVRKLLAVRQARRYLAKGNYNVLRLGYLQRLFPDLRIIIPFRDPLDHIASLHKQHRFFLDQHRQDERIGRHLSLSGHFEFGPHRKAVHFGDDDAWRAIEQAWSEGREVEGWARYWAETYRYLLGQTRSNPALEQACLFVSYERLCDESGPVIDSLLAHCGLDPQPFEAARDHYRRHLSRPAYYRHDFSAEEQERVRAICGPVLSDLKMTEASS